MIPATDLPALADRFQRFGALQQAERLYRQAAEIQPDDADLWARLGRVRHALGHHDEAVSSLRRALQLRSEDPLLYNDLGVALMEQGRLEEAVDSIREALRLCPDDPEAHKSLGIARMEQGDPGAAASCFHQALVLNADDPVSACYLGDALVSLGEHGQAIDWYGRAVEFQPEFARAWLNLGRTLSGLGRFDDAVDCYERTAQLRPDDPEPIADLGNLLMERGELDAAVARYEQVLRLRPDSAGAYSNMGLALMGQGRLEEARLSFEQALYLQPDLAEVHNNLGLAYMNQGRLDEAQPCFEQAIRLRPDLADAHNNLGLALVARGRDGDALDSYERAVRIDPDHLGALTNLGNAYQDQGRATEAIAFYRRTLAVGPGAAHVHSNLILAMQYEAGADPREIFAEARNYARWHADPLTGAIEPERVQIRPLRGRRLRIGYVSAHLREHAVCYFLEPILAAHDHHRFEIVCYTDLLQPDTVTERLQGHADLWRSLVGLSDAQAADWIRRDEIDILVDLDGHTGRNRLPVFARKPAPLQASYLGFLGTTGLPVMDAYITDAHADPLGLSETLYTERLIRLPECGFCYQPGPTPEVSAELPARQSGQVTFGCLNNRAKVSDKVLAVWTRVLAEMPGSRLVLRSAGGRDAEERVRSILDRHGITPERLMFAGSTATRFDYLARYHAMDIALDPFPYNGVTTTCDALWMGVPVVSLAGRMGVSRQGVRFLRNVGLDELIAETPEDYVRIATDLAADWPRLAALHSGLRERMSQSPLLDAPRLTRDLEAAYLAMWENGSTSCGPITATNRSE